MKNQRERGRGGGSRKAVVVEERVHALNLKARLLSWQGSVVLVVGTPVLSKHA